MRAKRKSKKTSRTTTTLGLNSNVSHWGRFSLRTILIVVTLFACASMIVATRYARYNVQSLVRVNRHVVTTIFPDDYDEYKVKQIDLLTSPQVLENAVSQLDGPIRTVFPNRPDTIRWIEKHLEIKNLTGSEIFAVNIGGNKYRVPAKAVVGLCEAILSAYMNEHIRQETERMAPLEAKLQQMSDELEQTRENVERLRRMVKFDQELQRELEWAESLLKVRYQEWRAVAKNPYSSVVNNDWISTRMIGTGPRRRLAVTVIQKPIAVK